jgi:hypothetical protein
MPLGVWMIPDVVEESKKGLQSWRLRKRVTRLKRIDNFLCSMLVFAPFA